jgi:predicted transglutaminase-like cysteine proteinase
LPSHLFASARRLVRQLALRAGPVRGWRQAVALGLLAVAALGTPSHAWHADELLRASTRFSLRARAAVPPLVALLTAMPQRPHVEQLRQINQFFNTRLDFRPDIETWAQEDYWASPLEALDKGQGDCEDYAIAKYLSLVSGGMPSSQLRLVYVRARIGAPGEPPTGQPHMVLAYYAEPQAEPLILDNLTPEILPASKRPDLTPVFSFNADSLWQGVGATTAGDPLARLTRWRTVLQKAREEGFH